MPADFGGKLFVRQIGKNPCSHKSGEGAELIGARNVVFDAVANTKKDRKSTRLNSSH